MRVLKKIVLFFVNLVKRILGIIFTVIEMGFAILYGLSPLLTIVGLIMLLMFHDTVKRAWTEKDLQDAWFTLVVIILPLFSRIIFKLLMSLCEKLSRVFLFDLPFSDRKYQEMCYEQDHRNDRNGTVTLSAEQFRALFNRR